MNTYLTALAVVSYDIKHWCHLQGFQLLAILTARSRTALELRDRVFCVEMSSRLASNFASVCYGQTAN
jgi:hypothetical protein